MLVRFVVLTAPLTSQENISFFRLSLHAAVKSGVSQTEVLMRLRFFAGKHDHSRIWSPAKRRQKTVSLVETHKFTPESTQAVKKQQRVNNLLHVNDLIGNKSVLAFVCVCVLASHCYLHVSRCCCFGKRFRSHIDKKTI